MFSGRERGAPARPVADPGQHVEDLLAAYEATIQRQLEEGLRRIQLTASTLMHEIASEVWRTAGGEKGNVRERILHELSRDEALRGLIAHADERFQALALRTERLEETLNQVAGSIRSTRDQLSQGAGMLGEAASGAASEELRAQLAEVTRQVAMALGTLAERDQAIVETVRTRVREHGELITQETTRISAAMEAYVQQGVEAIGRLAGSVDAQIHGLEGSVDAQVRDLAASTEVQIHGLEGSVDTHVRELAASTETQIRELAASTEAQIRGLEGSMDAHFREFATSTEAQIHSLGDNVDTQVRGLTENMDAQVRGLTESVEAHIRGLTANVDAEVRGLTENVDGHVQALGARDDEVSARILHAVEQQMSALGEQLQLVFDRMAIDTSAVMEAVRRQGEGEDERTRAVGEYLHLLHERIDVASRDGLAEMRTSLESRVMGLAQLVRSDSEALRRELVRTAEALDERAARTLDERLAEVSAAVMDGTGRMLNELGRRMHEDLSLALRGWVDEALARLEAQADRQSRQIDGRSEEALSAIDRNMVRMTDTIEGQFERLGRAVGERMTEAADLAIGGRLDDVVARLQEATGTVELLQRTIREGNAEVEQAVERSLELRVSAIERSVDERTAAVERSVEQRTAEVERSVEQRTAAVVRSVDEHAAAVELSVDQRTASVEVSVDQRISALARLVRSDNETIAQQIVADQDATKQSLRAMKELQANLPAEVIEMVEQRFASLAESLERSNETLAKRIDRMAVKIGERYDNDIQVVVDRMGDAMHALASLGRPEPAGSAPRLPEPRIELE